MQVYEMAEWKRQASKKDETPPPSLDRGVYKVDIEEYIM